MAGEGPTTVGSINAKLTLDYSDFMGKLAEADAAARKLGSVDPKIQVDANTAAADSKLAATEAAAKKVGAASPNIQVKADVGAVAAKLAAVEAAQRKLAIATEASRLAYLRLDEIQGKEGASAVRVAAAHLAASRAEESEKNATDRLAAAKAALIAAENAAAASTGRSDAAMQKSNATNAGSIQRWQLMAALIIALIPLLAPLAGYAVGVAGAFAGMGAAGALAIYGIIRAMKEGTQIGADYKTGLTSLKGSLDSLANTAATAMLGSFRTAVAQINAALPMLNGQIRTFGQILGNVGNAVLSGVISALRILNPLFVEASTYVLQLARGFQAWASGGGLQKFADYARTQLPLVADALGSLASAALHIIEALAPLGTVVVQGLTLLGGAINAIPLPVLLDVATAAAAGFAAFKVWGLIQPILSTVAAAIGAVGLSTQLAAGPIGWITAGISALAAVLAVSVTSTQQASQAAVDYANALQQDNDKIGENVRLLAVKNLHDSGAIKSAHQLGISTSTLTEAAIGNADAMRKVDSVLTSVQSGLGSTGSATGNMTAKQNEQAAAVLNVKDALKGQGSALEQAKIRQQENKDATSQANSVLGTNADVMTAMKDATEAAATATDKLSKELAGLGQVNLDASQANIAYNQSVADAAATTKQYGQSLDVTTEAGRKNMASLNGIASSAISLIAAQAKAGAATNVLSGNMAAARQQFINAAVAAGATAAQANHLADQYGLIPKNVSTAVSVTGADAARNKVAELQSWIDSLHGKTVQIVANVTQAGTAGHLQGFANGGTIGMLHAAAGMTMPSGGSPHVDSIPTMLAPTEEVISNRWGQASTNRMLLKAINAGANRMQVAQLANAQAGYRQQPPAVYVTVTSNGVDLSRFIDVRVDAGVQSDKHKTKLQGMGGTVL